MSTSTTNSDPLSHSLRLPDESGSMCNAAPLYRNAGFQSLYLLSLDSVTMRQIVTPETAATSSIPPTVPVEHNAAVT